MVIFARLMSSRIRAINTFHYTFLLHLSLSPRERGNEIQKRFSQLASLSYFSLPFLSLILFIHIKNAKLKQKCCVKHERWIKSCCFHQAEQQNRSQTEKSLMTCKFYLLNWKAVSLKVHRIIFFVTPPLFNWGLGSAIHTCVINIKEITLLLLQLSAVWRTNNPFSSCRVCLKGIFDRRLNCSSSYRSCTTNMHYIVWIPRATLV